MGKYVIDTDDPASEPIWQAYKQAQYNTRDQVGVAYRSVGAALAMYADLAKRLTEGNLAPAAEYHVAASAGLLKSEAALIGHLQAAISLIDEMQAEREGLFPGVPVKTEKPVAIEPAAIAVLG